ncbi:MAG: SWIM zinc finger family protein [Candidatus Falkowbacteria bacterium]
MSPKFDLNTIKYSVDQVTFDKAVGLYERGKVGEFREDEYFYHAVVQGTEKYNVTVSRKGISRGECDCYLGQREILCKHVIAVALMAVLSGRAMENEEKIVPGAEIKFNGRLGELSITELTEFKQTITEALRYIKSYNGPSRTWFDYQDSLNQGCRRMSALVSELPTSPQTTDLLVKLLLRLDRKLSNAVDDSDGVVGGFMTELVELLEKFTDVDQNCIKSFKILCGISSMFGWEEPLVEIYSQKIASK